MNSMNPSRLADEDSPEEASTSHPVNETVGAGSAYVPSRRASGGCTPRDHSVKKSSSCCWSGPCSDASTREVRKKLQPPSSWNKRLLLSTRSLRYAIKHTPHHEFMRKTVRVLTPSIPSILLPAGITRRCVSIRPDLTADWVWPQAIFSQPSCVSGLKWLTTPSHDIPKFRDLIRTQRVVLYFHGGAYVVCSNGTHRDIVYRLCKASGAIIFAVDYRCIPNTDMDGILDDALDAYRFLLGLDIPASNIVIAGDSAGAALSLLLMMRVRDMKEYPLPAAAALISPWVDVDFSQIKIISTHADKYDYLNPKFSAFKYVSDLVAGSRKKDDPRVSPLYGDVDGLPPMLIQYGEHEVLRSQIEAFISKSDMTFGDMVHEMVHVPHVFALFSIAAANAGDRMGEFVRDPMKYSSDGWKHMKQAKERHKARDMRRSKTVPCSVSNEHAVTPDALRCTSALELSPVPSPSST